MSDKTVIYKCNRCSLTKNVDVKDIKKDTKLQKSMKCIYCDSGIMQLVTT